MKSIIILFIVAALAWYGFNHYNEVQELASEGSALFSQSAGYSKCTTSDGRVIYGQPPVGVKCIKNESIKSAVTIVPGKKFNSESSDINSELNSKPSITAGKYHCDGRTTCSQMTSCEEATFFLRNCPNVKMDGNNDGVPCERQWCS